MKQKAHFSTCLAHHCQNISIKSSTKDPIRLNLYIRLRARNLKAI